MTHSLTNLTEEFSDVLKYKRHTVSTMSTGGFPKVEFRELSASYWEKKTERKKVKTLRFIALLGHRFLFAIHLRIPSHLSLSITIHYHLITRKSISISEKSFQACSLLSSLKISLEIARVRNRCVTHALIATCQINENLHDRIFKFLNTC